MTDIKSLLTDSVLCTGRELSSTRPIFKHTGESFIMAKPVADVIAVAEPDFPLFPNVDVYKSYHQTVAGQAMKIGTDLDRYISELNYPKA